MTSLVNRPFTSRAGPLRPYHLDRLGLMQSLEEMIERSHRLCLSVRTIEFHRARICEKLELKGAHALIKFAVEHHSHL